MTNDCQAVAARVAAFYADCVAPRMAGLPFLNPALAVEVVGFHLWQGQWLGCVVTPWSLNLMLLPRDASLWPALAAGAKRRVRFAAGEFEFVCGIDPAFGEHHDCSLFSPAREFLDQAAARATARAALSVLNGLDDIGRHGLDCEAPSAPLQHPCSRRGFLRLRGGSPNGN